MALNTEFVCDGLSLVRELFSVIHGFLTFDPVGGAGAPIGMVLPRRDEVPRLPLGQILYRIGFSGNTINKHNTGKWKVKGFRVIRNAERRNDEDIFF